MANNSLLASDNFASGSLAPGWAAITGLSTCHVVADSPKDTQPNVLSTEAGQIYTGNAFPNNQISEAVFTLVNEAGTNGQLCVRMQSNAYSGYKVAFGGTSATIYRMDSGTPTQLIQVLSQPVPAAGDMPVSATCCVINVSIHARARRATCTLRVYASPYESFNPRPRAAGDS